MQAKGRILRTLIAVLIASLVLSACSGGGKGGSTWFNLPSLPITIDENGNGKALGFSVGSILQPALVGQLQQAGVNVLEVRIGFNGIFLYANGDALPYLSWNDESVESLKAILANTPGAERAVSALPWLRRIGIGALLILPGAGKDIPRWRGEELVTPESPSETTLGPLTFASLAYDENGKPSIEGVPLAEIESVLGASLGLDLPPVALQILKGIGAQQLTVTTQPNGIDLAIDGKALPGLAYDSARLERTLNLAKPLVADPSLVETLDTVVPQLPGADINIVVSFTGQPAGETQLTTIPVKVNEDGTLSAYGIPLGASPILQPDVLAKLQGADIQKLDVNIVKDSLYIATNQKPLPVISWTGTSLETFGNVAGDLLGVSPGLLGPGLAIVRSIVEKTNIGMSLDLPVAAGAEALSFEGSFDVAATSFAAAAEGAKPELQLGVSFDPEGNLVSLGGVPASALAAAGAPAVNLPSNVMALLGGLGASQLQLTTEGNTLELLADANRLLAVQYDNDSLQRALGIAALFVSDPSQLQSVGAALPEILGSNLNVVISLTGEPVAATKLTSLPLSVKEDGTLSVYGFALGAQPILQPKFIEDMQKLNVQRLDMNIVNDNLYLATNGENLPVLSWNDASLGTLQRVVGELVGISPDLLGAGIAFLRDSDVGIDVSLPPAPNAEPVSVDENFDVTAVQMEAPNVNAEEKPVLQLALTINGSEIQSIGGVPASTWRALGVALPSLPPNVSRILYDGLQADQLQLMAKPNGLDVVTDGQTLVSLAYDTGSLRRTLNLASPFLPPNVAEALTDPNVSALLLDQILPLLVGIDLDVTAVLE